MVGTPPLDTARITPEVPKDTRPPDVPPARRPLQRRVGRAVFHRGMAANIPLPCRALGGDSSQNRSLFLRFPPATENIYPVHYWAYEVGRTVVDRVGRVELDGLGVPLHGRGEVLALELLIRFSLGLLRASQVRRSDISNKLGLSKSHGKVTAPGAGGLLTSAATLSASDAIAVAEVPRSPRKVGSQENTTTPTECVAWSRKS